MPKWMLVREEPYQVPEEYAWDKTTQNKFKLDYADVAFLEDGNTLFNGDVAYSLEEVEEVGT